MAAAVKKLGVAVSPVAGNCFLGGKWRHGVGSRYVWSKYDHNNKTHKTTVQGAALRFSGACG
ncbi:lactococcin 972 family bacteriocin [Streptococcus equi]|uniref:lactococcin 972 family bacteriocin n=1 Tax=Streptococcus equi TaxID=1336 RepID=UPI001E5CDC27|nr:lactococcin 972 family bacteriocin [Streptococcus equi]